MKKFLLASFFLFLLFIFLKIFSCLFVDYLFFKQIGYNEIFLKILLIKIIFFFIGLLFCAISAALLPLLFYKFLIPERIRYMTYTTLKEVKKEEFRKWLKIFVSLTISIVILLCGLVFSGKWDVFIRILYPQEIGIKSDFFIKGKDVGWFLTTLEVFMVLSKLFIILLLAVAILNCLILALGFFQIIIFQSSFAIDRKVKIFFSLVLGFSLIILYFHLGLLKIESEIGKILSPGVYYKLIGFEILRYICLICGILVIMSGILRRISLSLFCMSFLGIATVFFIFFIPWLLEIKYKGKVEAKFYQLNKLYTKAGFELFYENLDFPTQRQEVEKIPYWQKPILQEIFSPCFVNQLNEEEFFIVKDKIQSVSLINIYLKSLKTKEFFLKKPIFIGNLSKEKYFINPSFGISVDNTLIRLCFALRYLDISFLNKGKIPDNSKVIPNFKPQVILKKILPLMMIDKPYAILQNGILKWVLYYYTSSNLFPSSLWIKGKNYIRPGIVAIINSYDGSLRLFFNEKCPIINSFKRIYDNFYLTFQDIPKSIREKLIYPEVLFIYQAKALCKINNLQHDDIFYIPQNKSFIIPLVKNQKIFFIFEARGLSYEKPLLLWKLKEPFFSFSYLKENIKLAKDYILMPAVNFSTQTYQLIMPLYKKQKGKVKFAEFLSQKQEDRIQLKEVIERLKAKIKELQDIISQLEKRCILK